MQTRMLKYKLYSADKWGAQTVEIPASATIKHIAFQNTLYGLGIMAWAEVVADIYPVTRVFTLIATGEEVPEKGEYMKTLEYESGTIWHLYEIKE